MALARSLSTSNDNLYHARWQHRVWWCICPCRNPRTHSPTPCPHPSPWRANPAADFQPTGCHVHTHLPLHRQPRSWCTVVLPQRRGLHCPCECPCNMLLGLTALKGEPYSSSGLASPSSSLPRIMTQSPPHRARPSSHGLSSVSQDVSTKGVVLCIPHRVVPGLTMGLEMEGSAVQHGLTMLPSSIDVQIT